MNTPEPVTPLDEDYNVRAHTAYDLEVTLVRFIVNLFNSARLDNPQLNLHQPQVVSFDPTERAQQLDYKKPP